MPLTKREFEFIAEDLRFKRYLFVGSQKEWNSYVIAVQTLSEVLSRTNLKFDQDRFLIACGTHHQGGNPKAWQEVKYLSKEEVPF